MRLFSPKATGSNTGWDNEYTGRLESSRLSSVIRQKYWKIASK